MTIDREELRRLCDAATPGPWFLRTNRHPTTSGRDWGWLDYQRQSASHPPGLNVTWEDGSKSRDNALFVAAARTAVPELLDALEAAEAREKRLQKGLNAVADLINQSHGVVGLHLNGDIAIWEELRAGGYMEEWLVDFDAAIAETAP